MNKFQLIKSQYKDVNCRDLSIGQLEHLRDELKSITPGEVASLEDGMAYIELLGKFRKASAEMDRLHGDKYPELLNSLLSVGEDGLYSNNLRFIFELIQNVDDCDFDSTDDCNLDMRFDFNEDKIILTYNEIGFTPFNVFAITGIAEAAKNISPSKSEIGEKGIGFKSVFGVAKKVRIRSGWFSFELYKENFTIPIPCYKDAEYCRGTQMTLFVPGRAKSIYREIKERYCSKDALFSGNPLLFLNKLTHLKMYFDKWRCMEFHVSRSKLPGRLPVDVERDVMISVHLHDYENGNEKDITESIRCSRYSYPVVFSRKACQSRYGEDTQVGKPDGKQMILQAVLPNQDYLPGVGNGSLYSFLPTQLKLTVPMVCHVPFKLDASREFVDPQNENEWFKEACLHLSNLIDQAYLDWKTIVKENIVQYIPGANENLFARNNGKEKCLKQQECFLGSHYLKLRLFFCIDGKYHHANDIFCLAPEEKISDPKTVCRLMGFKGFLFNTTVPVRKFSIRTEQKIKDRLFRRALTEPSVTSQALSYLDSAGYTYLREELPKDSQFTPLTPEQVEVIFKHPKLSKLLVSLSCQDVRNDRRFNCTIMLKNASTKEIKDVLEENFDISEAPQKVENYMRLCQEKCVCLDIEEDAYLPFYNALVLSERNPLDSFAAFCRAIDKNDAFTIRMQLRKASRELNQYEDETECSASDYLRKLRNVRLLIKDSIGNKGYKRYIELILNSGTDAGRYIQELLQNADDCHYPAGINPSFTLKKNGGDIVIEYNEVGFSRADIRSITAIGESTKNSLFDSENKTIGEKGVGFKTIFAVAKEVRVYSGEYAFSLTEMEPTIPKEIRQSASGVTSGTRMEIILKDQKTFPLYSENTLLTLCLCLRKLRLIQIGSFNISIEDIDSKRVISINGRRYEFQRFTHAFTVTDASAMTKRRSENRRISPDQTIVCYVPENAAHASSDYALYCGLPTKHRIKIPMAIDAPFVLTTSREEIETGDCAWNDIVRKEVYSAILSVMNSLKEAERENVFRFTRFVPRRSGNLSIYVNDFSDNRYLNSYNILDDLKSMEILPTFNRNVFVTPLRENAYRYPEAANIIFRIIQQEKYAGIASSSIIDVKDPAYDAVLNALGCKKAQFEKILTIIRKYAEPFIRQEEFRTRLYEFLQDTPEEYKELIKNLAIIPVWGKTAQNVDYIKWAPDSIFVKKDANTSAENYYVLNEKLLSKNDCEKIFGVNINEMNDELKRSRYCKWLREILRNSDMNSTYKTLMEEFRSGALKQNEAYETLVASQKLPLKNEIGRIVDSRIRPLFLCDQPLGYFPTRMLRSMIVHKECSDFAKCLRLEPLGEIHYEDISYHEMLTADDVESLSDDYFLNSEELLRGFYKDELLSDELLNQYNLEFLTIGRTYDDNKYDFPSEPVADRISLRNYVRKLWKIPIKIVSVIVEKNVQKGENKDGFISDLPTNDAREETLRIYTPAGAQKRCFCQMCKRLKPYPFIEVNNIELSPKYYFSQLRVALCLECSKEFEYLRKNEKIRENFLRAIKTADIQNQGIVEIPIGSEDTIKFTGKHLAEIQEILLQMPE